MKNTRGISSIIATLILILLTIVLIGIVWVVVSGIVSTSTKNATSGAQCFNSAVQVTSATCNSTGACNVTVQRTTGTDTLGGVRLVFLNAAKQSNVADVNATGIVTLQSVTATNVLTGISNVNEVDAAIYFTDAAGNKNACSGVVPFTTVQQI
jgi:flagellin-like protein